MEIGVLAFQGSVTEHISATKDAARRLGIGCHVAEVRLLDDLTGLQGLVIPGGESTAMYKLCEREGMLDAMRNVPAVFGTCAGAIMLARRIHNEEAGQKTLALMDLEIDRNAYGTQSESFEDELDTALGRVKAVFIRAPKIKSVGPGVKTLAKRGDEIIACEQRAGSRFYLATCFHPELSTTIFHGHFIRNLQAASRS